MIMRLLNEKEIRLCLSSLWQGLAHFMQEVLRLHFNFRIGADVPKVAVEGKFGPRAYTSISECSLVPEVADECKFGPCAYTSVSRCLMSLTWAIKQIAVSRVGTPILGGAGARTMSLRRPDLLACCGV